MFVRRDISEFRKFGVEMPTVTARRGYASDQEQASAPAATGWKSRPVVATLLRLVIALLPITVAGAITVTLQAFVLVPALTGRGVWPHVAAYIVLAAATLVVARLVERFARRALPLVALLRLSMLFPEQAPSRFQMARTAGNPAALNKLAEQTDEEGAAAAQVLALLARLSEHERRTRGHSERVRVYTDLIGEQLGLPESDRLRLRLGALVHDVGKLTVPAEVLTKAGRPTPEEWATLQGHPEAGIALAGPVIEWLGPWSGCVNEHHERYDGNGYPSKLAGDEISLGGRIVAVADAFETMTANRSYKKQMSVTAARKELTDCAGAHFDPAVVRAFTEISLPALRRRTLAAGIFVNVPVLGPAASAVGQLLGLTGPAGSGALAALAGAAPTSAAVMGVLATGVAIGLVPSTAASGPAARSAAPTQATLHQGQTSSAGTEQLTRASTALQGATGAATSHHIATHPETVVSAAQPPVKSVPTTSSNPPTADPAPAGTSAVSSLAAATSTQLDSISRQAQNTLKPVSDGAQKALGTLSKTAGDAVNDVTAGGGLIAEK
jgi:hypothetical protein